jgi:hypothetical protein
MAGLGRLRAPSTWSREDMKAEFIQFLRVYKDRPYGRKKGGMLMEHSFAYWYMLRKTQPAAVVESGIFQGHSTWLARQALPSALIISIDPGVPAYKEDGSDKHVCLCGGAFRDFSTVNWTAYGVDPGRTMVLFDDHQSGVRRTLEAFYRGFKHLVYDDNYRYPGDNYSLKAACDTRLSGQITFTDDFGRISRPMEVAEHAALGKVVAAVLEEYAEFPPLAWLPRGREAPEPLFEDAELAQILEQHAPGEDFRGLHYGSYVHMAYAKAV